MGKNDVHEKVKIMESSEEYKIFKRFSNLDFLWNLCNSNKDELFEVIENLEQTLNMMLFQIYDEVTNLLTRRLINHVGTISLLVDHTRNENKYLEKNGINIGYKDKVNECFICNPNTQFVHGLRNYVIHNKIIKPEIISYVIDNELNISILTLSTEKLLESGTWKSYARKYIIENNPKINLKTCLIEYYNQQKIFFNWFKLEFRKIFEKEILYCEKIINERNTFFDRKRKEFEEMPFDKLISLPQIVCDSENGFTITRVEN